MKRNILPKLILIAIFGILVSSCSEWFENEFVPLPTHLYPLYEEGDTFLYRSIETWDVDTFVVSSFVFDTVYNGLVLFERTSAFFLEVVADTFGDDWFYVSNEPNGSFFLWDSDYVHITSSIETLDTTIKYYDYSDLFVVFTPVRDSTSERLHKIYFDWNYGLVKYTYHDLDSYELFSRPE